MNSLKIFNSNEFGEMRTYSDPRTGEVWFNLNDVCKALELTNPSIVKKTLTNKGLISLNVRDLGGTLSNTYGTPAKDLDNTITNSYGIPTEDLDSTLTISEGTPTKDLGGNPNMTFIDEGNLYQVIFQSRKPNAVKFKECFDNLHPFFGQILKGGTHKYLVTFIHSLILTFS